MCTKYSLFLAFDKRRRMLPNMSGVGDNRSTPRSRPSKRGNKTVLIGVSMLLAFTCSFLIWRTAERILGNLDRSSGAVTSESVALPFGADRSNDLQLNGATTSRGSVDRKTALEIVYLSEPWPVVQPIDDDLFPIIDPFPKLSSGSLQVSKAGGGRLKGRISFLDEPPAETVIAMDLESSRLREGLSAPTTQFYVVSDDGEVADVVVYLEGKLPLIRTAEDFGPLTIDHFGSMKTPYVSATGIGQSIILTNSDPLMHVVHITPKPGTANRESSHSLAPSDPTALEIAFYKPELFIRLKCDVHPWEFAYISIFDHYFFDVTDLRGEFSISDIPPGTYTLHAVHRKFGEISAEIEMKRGQTNVIDLVFDSARSRHASVGQTIRPIPRRIP